MAARFDILGVVTSVTPGVFTGPHINAEMVICCFSLSVTPILARYFPGAAVNLMVFPSSVAKVIKDMAVGDGDSNFVMAPV